MALRNLPSARQASVLKPVLRVYILAYLTTASPRLLSLIIGAARGRLEIRVVIARIKAVILQEAGLDRFPAACCFLVGGSIVIHELLASSIARIPLGKSSAGISHLYGDYGTRYIAAFASAWVAFRLLNKRPSRPIKLNADYSDQFTKSQLLGNSNSDSLAKGRRRRSSSVQLGSNSSIIVETIPPLAGKTLDLTVFAFVRALGVVVNIAWSRYRKGKRQPSTLALYLEKTTAPTIFAISSFIIMFNWFYSPERLPGSYRNWISSAAQIDPRLVEVLRQCRYGNFVYFKDTGLAPILRSMCRDLGYPEAWGDPAITVPVPCELYHSGTGHSCEWHGIVRFTKAWIFGMKMYLPLNVLMLSRRDRTKRSLGRAFVEASRSSTFLGVFVASFYYAVCLARTRIGPRLFSRERITPTMWDSGLCVGSGCMACGWSILLENPARRQEVSFFVAPRALATILPRRYDRLYMSREQMTFALSAAVILVAAQQEPSPLHGVFGRLLSQVFK